MYLRVKQVELSAVSPKSRDPSDRERRSSHCPMSQKRMEGGTKKISREREKLRGQASATKRTIAYC